MSHLPVAIQNFRSRIRALADKRYVRKRELLNVLFDVYELFMVLSDELDEQVPPSMSSLFGGAPVMKVSEAEFDEIMRKKEATKKKDLPGGQYL